MPRSRSYIEGDIKSVTRSLERLQAELAALPPVELTFRSKSGNAPITFKTRNGNVVIHQSSAPWWEYDVAHAEALRDWLNYNFPAKTEAAKPLKKSDYSDYFKKVKWQS